MTQLFKSAQEASRKVNQLTEAQINTTLLALADETVKQSATILAENKKDLDRMPTTDPRYDRLKLSEQRLQDIANDLRNVSRLASPLGIVMEERSLPNGLQLKKISVPLGVIGIIYEARPNVTFDVFSLCLKSGSACLLKGGSDAEYSNLAIVGLIKSVLRSQNITEDAITLLPTDRTATHEMLHAVGYVDVIIPRGSQNLINYVRDNSKVPVIETGAGIVHTYFHATGDTKKGSDIIFNSKTRRVSVCNALDCLVIDNTRLKDLNELTQHLAEKNVIIYADEPSYKMLAGHYPASLLEHAAEEHYGIEFLDYKMSIKTVSGFTEAMDHIAKHSSKHSEAIVAEDANTIQSFFQQVDAAAVYANTSTAFTDGAQFGLGAEIGISTQKLHARGPMALREITSYKWLVSGNGQIRS